MKVALDTPVQLEGDKRSSVRAGLMTFGFLMYTLLILAGHIVGFPLAYTYLHTVCASNCALTPANVHALARSGLSINFSANLYIVIQMVYILVCVGIALLIVVKKPGQWVPLGMSCFLVGLSAYEGANYPALTTSYPILHIPAQFLIGLGMGIVGMYALLTFPNGKFGSRWVLGYFLFQAIEGLFALFITNPVFVLVDNVLGLLSFPIILGILIYRYRRLLNARERAATRWLIVSWSVFIPTIILATIAEVIVPGDSLAFLLLNLGGSAFQRDRGRSAIRTWRAYTCARYR